MQKQSMKAAPTPREPHPAAVALEKDVSAIICAALWQLRHQLPDMTLQIEVEEIEKFHSCLAYNQQKAVPRITATHDRLVVGMADASGAGIIQSESTMRDLEKKERLLAVRRMASEAQELVAQHRSLLARGEESEQLTRELHEVVLMLAKAVA